VLLSSSLTQGMVLLFQEQEKKLEVGEGAKKREKCPKSSDSNLVLRTVIII